MIHPVERTLKEVADPVKAAFFPRFFKSGPGQYGEGDIFIGVTVPQNRIVAKKFIDLPLKDVEQLLKSPLHECRLCALLILGMQFKKSDESGRKKIVDVYLKNTKYVNNWDLVDGSAQYILGPWLDGKDASVLDTLAVSGNLWEERIAIVSTFYFIRKGELGHTFRIAKLLMHHEHDLIHKAVGWMLREAGKKDLAALEAFLQKHYKTMPRTMLRYAIEKFEKDRYQAYLKGAI
jgi:3-methyladenine DNA glycosylase AlkD